MRHILTILAALFLCAAPAQAQTLKSLMYNTTNGQMVYGGTNTLTFTNRFGQSSTNATNPPEIRLTTKSNNIAGWFYYDASLSQTNPAAPDWSVLWLGNNHVASPNGQDRGRARQDIGAVSLTMENHWVTPVKTSPVSEVYFNTEDTNGLTTRPFFIMGSQTNSAIGGIEMKYPVTHTVNSNSIYWYGGNPQAAYTIFTDQEFLINARATTPAAMGRITFGTTDNGITAFLSGEGLSYARHWALGRSIYRIDTNGIVFGSQNANLAAAAPVHLAGSTRIDGAISFDNTTNAATTRTNLGLGATWLTNTNVTNFRTAIGLGATNDVVFNIARVNTLAAETGQVLAVQSPSGLATLQFDDNTLDIDAVTFQVGAAIEFKTTNNAATTRTNLGLGATNIVAFAGITNNGDITINQTTATNGLLYIRRTNTEAFLGLANLIASNNTTVSNETLFRVGVAEATNKSAQFGFRATNTNGNGVAVFSVFGFNALMQIGADASTNAVIYSGGGTNNEVMTLIRDGATEFARPLRFSTNAASKPSTNAPANTTNVAAWVEMQIGTNSYRLPLYQ